MKKIRFFFLLIMPLLLTSCIDIIEEITLNKDGSGRYTLTFDMSGFFSDPMMKGMFKDALQQDSTLDLSQMDALEVDTTINMGDRAAAELAELDNPDFWKKVSMRTVMSEQKGEMTTTIAFDFSDVSQINYFYANLNELSQEGSAMNGDLMGDSGLLAEGSLFELSGRSLTRSSAAATEKPEQPDEELAMMKMFFTSARYQTIYHLPGHIKKASIPGATIDGKTVTLSAPLLDLMENKASLNGTIKFKKR